MNLERYQRHSLVDWFDQRKLSESSVIVVGAGAIGNEILKNLCLLGVGRIHIIDFDRIEEHNLTRAILFKPTDIGSFKAETAAAACLQIDPNLKVSFANCDFWLSLSIEGIASYDAVLCCVDNLEARIRLNQLCLIAHVDFYNAGIDSRNVSVEMYPYRTSADCACYECWLPASAYQTIRKRYSCGWLKRIALAERKVPTTAITSSMAGACMASFFLQRKCDHPDKLNGSAKFTLDTVTFASSMVSITQYELCPGCSRFHSSCHRFPTKRLCAANGMARLIYDKDLTVFLSEPIILDCQCQSCGHKREIMDLASKFDEHLADCAQCNLPSNAIRIVDSLSIQDLLEAFSNKPLPVKFLYFNRDDQQFLLELED